MSRDGHIEVTLPGCAASSILHLLPSDPEQPGPGVFRHVVDATPCRHEDRGDDIFCVVAEGSAFNEADEVGVRLSVQVAEASFDRCAWW
ncbi:hypothetical protein DEJ36_16335 [Curtobacterium sp. MCPF17_052]|nr:hypothetical protein [Curtobacterium sp. MCPF17_052]WIB12262.1 hypothetical protein DEJ36_16335 [Curtobacterium sp. MCPF17_052]